MILTARTVLQKIKTQTAEQQQAWAEREVAKLRAMGAQVAMHEDPEPRVARIDDGRWLIDCACGAGNLVDPAWTFATCLECGAVHRAIIFPDNRKDIEAVLIQRPHVENRYWSPHETVADLQRENEQNGIKKKGAVTS
jgi:hypothetical protein